MSQLSNKVQIAGRRVIAFSIDVFLASFLCIGMFLLLLPLSMYISKEELLFLTDKIDTSVNYYVFIFVYFTIQEVFWHKTIGKRIFRLKIVHSEEKQVRRYQIIVRNIFRVIDIVTIIGFVIIPFNSKNRRLGDIVSKTMIVEDKQDI